jgi:hypothetical protein
MANALSQLSSVGLQPQRRYVPQAYIANFPRSPTRLLANVGDFEHIWELIQTNEKARSLYEQLKNDSQGILQQPTPTRGDPSAEIIWVSREMLRRIYTLGLIYRLEGDNRYLDKAWENLQSVANFPDWNHASQFLDTAEMTHAFAIGYDWFPWTEKQRTTLRDAIVTKGLTPALQCYSSQPDFGWWVTSPSGWNMSCNGGIGMGALALSPELPELCQEILGHALQSLQLSMGDLAPDGAWPEGPTCWGSATYHSSTFLAALETAIGKDFGLGQMPGFSDTGLFPIYMTGPTVRTFNFGDSLDVGLGLEGAPQMLWLARQFGRSTYSWYVQTLTAGLNNIQSDDNNKYNNIEDSVPYPPPALNLLWFDPGERDPNSEGLPLDKNFGGRVQMASFRTAWNDGNALFVGLKAGDNTATHTHLDVGTFVVDALGRRWALDLGRDRYGLPGYWDGDGQRWTYYRMRAEGHNTLVLNPSNEPDQNPWTSAKITRFLSEPAKAFAIANLTPVYETSSRWLQKLERGIALLNRATIVVQDEITVSQPSELWWFMHTPASVQLDENERTAMLEQGGVRLWCALASPSDAKFSVLDAKPLPSSPNPPGQTPNSGVKKLAVHLSGVTSTILSVVMVPLSTGQEPPSQVPSVIPLAQW